MKPISWSVWAGQIEKEGGARNPYRRLEERPGFIDIRVSLLVTELDMLFSLQREKFRMGFGGFGGFNDGTVWLTRVLLRPSERHSQIGFVPQMGGMLPRGRWEARPS